MRVGPLLVASLCWPILAHGQGTGSVQARAQVISAEPSRSALQAAHATSAGTQAPRDGASRIAQVRWIIRRPGELDPSKTPEGIEISFLRN